jgi:hypothetical protein
MCSRWPRAARSVEITWRAVATEEMEIEIERSLSEESGGVRGHAPDMSDMMDMVDEKV